MGQESYTEIKEGKPAPDEALQDSDPFDLFSIMC